MSDDIGFFPILGGIVVIWLLLPIFFPIAGIWKREDDEEYLALDQFGPFITGKRNVDGGNHMYSGYQHFFWLSLSRRDYGLPALIAQGFPQVIAKKINGSVVAHLRLMRRNGQELTGHFRPQKILFDEASEKVLSRDYQPAQHRRYTKTNLVELPGGKVETVRTGLPPPTAKKITKKNTF